MAFDIVPGSFWSFPSFRAPSSIFDEEDDWLTSGSPSGISISEDEKKVYVTAALPGIAEEDIDITFNKGLLWIKGDTKTEEEDKKRKFYRRATSSFSYRVAVPGEIDPNSEPEATFKNGVMAITFTKSPASQPKKISVKKGK